MGLLALLHSLFSGCEGTLWMEEMTFSDVDGDFSDVKPGFSDVNPKKSDWATAESGLTQQKKPTYQVWQVGFRYRLS
jgi:hypothetical protein